MLRDRYEPIDLFEMVPSLSMQMDPVLAQMDRLLDNDPLFQMVKADLARRRPHTRVTVRSSMPVEVAHAGRGAPPRLEPRASRAIRG